MAAMTKNLVSLQTLLEEHAESELLREMIEIGAQRVVEL